MLLADFSRYRALFNQNIIRFKTTHCCKSLAILFKPTYFSVSAPAKNIMFVNSKKTALFIQSSSLHKFTSMTLNTKYSICSIYCPDVGYHALFLISTGNRIQLPALVGSYIMKGYIYIWNDLKGGRFEPRNLFKRMSQSTFQIIFAVYIKSCRQQIL